ncbi:hypothetical protein [Microbacterium sp. SLBN-111]|uniref:hypothetical protein n=1 Tax=Microbacterium sp. SLBN-111 TaxID=3377733 RepID=UPI003C74C807
MAENGAMPRLTGARAEMPDGAVRAQRVISTVNRIETARYLRRNPRSTRHEIAEGTGLNYESVRKELTNLADLGYVAVTGEGRGATFIFDGTLFSRDLGLLLGYLSE